MRQSRATPSTRARAHGPRIREVPAVTRSVAILRLLGKAEQPLGLNQIARTLGLFPSTCLHILRALVKEELVGFDPATKRYSLDVGILTLARRVIGRSAFSAAVQSSLDRLSGRYGVTMAGVKVIRLDHIVVVAISHSEVPLRLNVEIGSRFPALISATGRCLAAFGGHPQRELERHFRTLRWDRPPSMNEWRGEIKAARRNGYSVDKGNYIRGVTIVAVPVLDTRGIMSHGVVAIGVGEQMDQAPLAALITDMVSAAAAVSDYQPVVTASRLVSACK